MLTRCGNGATYKPDNSAKPRDSLEFSLTTCLINKFIHKISCLINLIESTQGKEINSKFYKYLKRKTAS